MIWLTTGLGSMLVIVLVFLFKWANQFVALYQVSETATNTDVGSAVTVPLALMNHDYLSAGISATSLIVFGTVAGWLMQRSERCVNTHLGLGAVGTCSHPLMLIVAAPLTQVVHFIALIRVSVLSHVTWRGIHYHIRSGHEITRKNYEPFVAENDTGQRSL